MTRSLLLSFLALSLAASPARADREQRQDRRELAQDRRQAADDHFDYVKLRSLLARFDQARAVNAIPQLQALEAELDGLVAAELRESQRELHQDRREAVRSQAEINRDRRQGRRTADDRRDRNDDVRDAIVESQHLQQTRAIAAELNSVAGRQDPAALAYRRERIVRLLALGGQEIAEDRRERREDRQERREDRHRR